MKTNKTKIQRLLALLLSIAILFTTTPMATAAAQVASPYEKIADDATLDGWKEFFGTEAPSTENAGGVWTDKSVFADVSAFQNLTDAYGDEIVPTVADDSFLVVLSAIASNKSIVGYSHIPTDTVLVLDISGSMGPDTWGSQNNDAVSDLVLAANAAITELLTLNNNNRVGVVLYSAEYNQGNDEHYYTLLPIDRYTATGTVTYNNGTRFDTSDDITVGEYLETNANNSHNGNEISIASGVSGSSGEMDETTIDVVGGTYIQGGLKAAADVFKAKSDANDTIVQGEGFQSGTQRKPVLVLMSDGAPTYVTTSFTAPADPNRGSGSSTNETYAFLTQLTAAYVKQQITSYYNGNEALFYTLGLGVGNSAVAESVLDPANSTATIDGYWEDYAAATNGATVEITDNTSVTKTDLVSDIVYADEYFEAESRSDLFEAFEKIVNEIIIQSLYRPTLVEENNADMEGYIEFIDDIGDYMKVEQIEGIMIGDKLYTGEKLCENFTEDGGELGTVTNPNPLGDNFIWAVQQRLEIENVEDARRLVSLAYEHGQLSYTDEDTYSNFIGWYADENGNYLGFWDESHTYSQIPAGAAYVNKSYGMLGEIADGYNESDLMYVSIQVHTEILSQSDAKAEATDTIMAGHAQLIYRIPASLIPVVTYDVSLEGTGYDDAKNIEMTITDAEPIRLVFELGLRNDINEYNIQEALGDEYRGTDGKYRLYTNEWSVEQFEAETHPESPTYIHPTASINTVAYFEPSYENERYYYSEPTPIYINQNGEYVKYSSDTKPVADDGNEYYRQINVFELTADTADGDAAVHKKVYERISDTALGRVDKSETNGGWNIRKETIHRVYDEIETPKTTNTTGTLGYSYFPTVEHIEGTHYYADAILGNNGLLTVTPATGISITKTVDASLEGVTTDFKFNVDIGDEAGVYDVIYRDPDRNFIDNDDTITLDADGKGEVYVKAGWTAYIVGVPAGLSYSVEEEIPSGANYKVSEYSGNSGTIAQYNISEVRFENTLSETGNLVITKRVTHPFATAPDSINDHIFKFDVELTNGTETYPDTTVEAYYSTKPNEPFTLDVVGNRIEDVELHGNEAIVIAVKENWAAVVTEDSNMPDGFTLDSEETEIPDDTTVNINSNVVYVFVNDYAPDAVSPDITIEASKTLAGRPWNPNNTTDEFVFELRRYDIATAQYITIASETVKNTGNSATVEFGSALTAAIKAESFTQVGTYHYSIKEVAPDDTKGITYDTANRDFDIVVTDTDTDGKLEIASVTNANRTTVTETTENAYTVKANDFVNTYKADGIAEVHIQIKKTVDTPDGIDYSPEGFEFGVYDKATGDLVSPLYNTDANGEAMFVFAYNADDVDYQNDKVIEYVIKETDTGLGGITYADDIDVTVTVKDNLDGTISAQTDIANTNNGVSIVEVENVYAPKAATLNIEGSKEYVDFAGEPIALAGDEFEFVLAEADESFNAIEGGKTDTAKNDSEGNFGFELSFEKVDDYHFVLTEKKGNDRNTQYDDTVYNVTVSVTDNGSGQLQYEVSYAIGNTAAEAVAFTNIYTPDPDAISVDFGIEKAVENKGSEKIGPEGFEFQLADETGEIAKVKTDEKGKAKITLDYTYNDIDKVFEYTLTEVDTGKANVTYSNAEYAITVVITLDEKTNTLVPKLTVNEAQVEEITVEFENIYDYSPPVPVAGSPKTGDTAWPLAIMVVALVAATYAYKKFTIRNA